VGGRSRQRDRARLGHREHEAGAVELRPGAGVERTLLPRGEVAERGALLPEEERTLAATWAAARHRVWEVVEGGATLRDARSGDERALDARSRAKVPSGGWVLAVVQEGPLALPGPVTTLNEELVEEVRALLATGDPHAIAALVGRELGWTSAPDLGSSPDPAPDALAPTP
jgi:hypothetical protein